MEFGFSAATVRLFLMFRLLICTLSQHDPTAVSSSSIATGDIAGSSLRGPKRLVLWKEGQDKYRHLFATIEHRSSCQPECNEERLLVVPPALPYKVKIEVASIDMQSASERVEIQFGGGAIKVQCNLVPASDYDCSLAACTQNAVGPMSGPEIRVIARSSRTRDTCKCDLVSNSTVDCYSALLSGLHETFGMLVRLTMIPDVQFSWFTGDWEKCDAWRCQSPGAVARRMVQCMVVPSSAGGIIGSHQCAEAPASERLCAQAPECTPPPSCGDCFHLAHVSNLGATLYLTHAADPDRDGLTHVSLSGYGLGNPIPLRLVAEPSNTSEVSLETCDGDRYLARNGSTRLVLVPLKGESSRRQLKDGNDHKLFSLHRVAPASFELHDLSSDAALGVVASSLESIPLASIVSPRTAAWSPVRFQAVAFGSSDFTCSVVAPSDLLRVCRFGSGLCCSALGQERCTVNAELESNPWCFDNCPSQGLVILSQDRCEVVNCSKIEEYNECEIAARRLGLQLHGTVEGVSLHRTSKLPTGCLWERETTGSSEATLWLNTQTTVANSTDRFRQICRCGGAHQTKEYIWETSSWTKCGLTCGMQWRYRNVTCRERHGASDTVVSNHDRSNVYTAVPLTFCRELPSLGGEPHAAEPCSVPYCYVATVHTRCAGQERASARDGFVSLNDQRNSSRRVNVVANASHCVEVNRAAFDAREICFEGCAEMKDCVGFTLYDGGFGAIKTRCCFLARATHWQNNFRGATCFLAQGVQTHSGCTCQVGWSHVALSGHASLCGASHGGCCMSVEHGAVGWCPTTSGTCGAPMYDGQQPWDRCDPFGIAIASEYTCRSQVRLSQLGCVSAHSVSQCSQIATSLGLPNTRPQLTLSIQKPSYCVWEVAASTLWLNQLVDAVNATDPSKKIAMHASPDLPELCHCPSGAHHWETSSWSSCFNDPNAACGAQIRTRSVFCVIVRIRGGGGQVVDDSHCVREQAPSHSEVCLDCSWEVLKAVIIFDPAQVDIETASQRAGSSASSSDEDVDEPNRGAARPPLKEAQFLRHAIANLVPVMSVDAERVRANMVDCCDTSIRIELLISGPRRGEVKQVGGAPIVSPAGDALQHLLQLTPSSRRRGGDFTWYNSFLAKAMSIQLQGTYTWESQSEWGGCSVRCGGGVQQREVACAFTDHRSDRRVDALSSLCDAGTKPSIERACGERQCRECPGFVLGPQYTVSGGAERSSHGEIVYVTCAAGYDTMDDQTLVPRTCDDGEWTPLEVSCGKGCHLFEEQVPAWKYAIHGSGLDHGSTRQVVCRDKFATEVLEAPPSATVVCQDGGWTMPELACTGDCQTFVLSAAYVVRGAGGGGFARNGDAWHVSCSEGFSSLQGEEVTILHCVEGNWVGLVEIPDCRASCPHYNLLEGYEAENKQSRHRVAQSTAQHGETLRVRCASGFGRVPGVTEEVRCQDGRWTSLALVCRQNCGSFNSSSGLDWHRYRIAREFIIPSVGFAQGQSSVAVRSSSVLHGSRVVIGCIRNSAAPPENSANGIGDVAQQVYEEELVCENGNWSKPSRLLCLHECPAFVAGPQFVTAVASLGLASVVSVGNHVTHGTRVLATCAEGYSAATAFQEGNTTEVSAPPWDSMGTVAMQVGDGQGHISLIDKAECVDGAWSAMRLACWPDCPPLRLAPAFVVSFGDVKAGTERTVRCAGTTAEELSVRCSKKGTWTVSRGLSSCPWLLSTSLKDHFACSDGTLCTGWSCCAAHGGRVQCPPNMPVMCNRKTCNDDFCCSANCGNDLHGPRLCEEEEPLDFNRIPLDCFEPALGLWEKLSSGESALVQLLIILFCFSVTGCAMTSIVLWLATYGSAKASQSLRSEEDGDDETRHVTTPTNRNVSVSLDPDAGIPDQSLLTPSRAGNGRIQRSGEEVVGEFERSPLDLGCRGRAFAFLGCPGLGSLRGAARAPEDGDAGERPTLAGAQFQLPERAAPAEETTCLAPRCNSASCGEPRLATHICFPCGHQCLCMECARLMSESGAVELRCPSCEGPLQCTIDANPSNVFALTSGEASSTRGSQNRSTWWQDVCRGANSLWSRQSANPSNAPSLRPGVLGRTVEPLASQQANALSPSE